jgi:hypothetical protein
MASAAERQYFRLRARSTPTSFVELFDGKVNVAQSQHLWCQ